MDIPVVILAGGLGTRMREETEYKPKPMVEVGGKPVLEHIISVYRHWGFCNFVVCSGYRGEVIRNHFANYFSSTRDFRARVSNFQVISIDPLEELKDPYGDYSVSVVDTGLKTETGGRVHRISKLLHSEVFMVTYGDGLANVNIKALLDAHFSSGRLATLTVTRPRSRFGVVERDEGGGVRTFREKPFSDSLVNIGFYVFSRDILSRLRPESILERDLLEQLALEGELNSYVHEGFWEPMDTFREYQLLNSLFDSEDTPPWLAFPE